MSDDGIIDASGRSADGKYWRSRTIFGAAAQYYNQSREIADQLDCVMDRIPAAGKQGYRTRNIPGNRYRDNSQPR